MTTYRKIIIFLISTSLLSMIVMFCYVYFLDCIDGYTIFPSAISVIDRTINSLGFLSWTSLIGLFALGITAEIQNMRGHSVWKVRIIGIILGFTYIMIASMSYGDGLTSDMVASRLKEVVEIETKNQSNQDFKGYENTCVDSRGIQDLSSYVERHIQRQGLLCSTVHTQVSCFGDKKSFVISVRVTIPKTETKQYYCVDSAGFSGIVNSQANGTTCPK